MPENRNLPADIWMEMSEKQPDIEEMKKYIKEIRECDPTLNEYDAIRICRFRQIYYDDLEKYLNIVHYYRNSGNRERSANDGMLFRLAEIGSKIELAERAIRGMKCKNQQEKMAYFRVLVETGIRHAPLVELNEENIHGNQIEMIDKKIGNMIYVDSEGRLPVISKDTKNMLVADEQGYYFHDTVRCYRRMIHAAMPQGSEIHIHDIRYFAQHRKTLYLCYENRKLGRYVVRNKENNSKTK